MEKFTSHCAARHSIKSNLTGRATMLLSLMLIISALTFSSCSGLFFNPGEDKPQTGNTTQESTSDGIFHISGSAKTATNKAKTAVPSSMPSCRSDAAGTNIRVYAVKTGENDDKTPVYAQISDVTTTSFNYSLDLRMGFNWKITAEVFNANVSDSTLSTEAVYSGSTEISLTQSAPDSINPMTLSCSTSGIGTVKLPVSNTTDYTVTATLSGGSLSGPETTYITRETQFLEYAELATGEYKLKIDIKSDTPIFTLEDTLYVYNTLTTDTWENSSYVSDGTLTISTEAISRFIRTTVYVSATGSDDAGTGAHTKPYATIQKAYDHILSLGNTTDSYRIRVMSDMTIEEQNNYFLFMWNNPPIEDNFRNITIESYNPASGTPFTLSCTSYYHFWFEDSCVITLKDINLTSTDSNSESIVVRKGSEVTVGEGCTITGSKHRAAYVADGGKLILDGGTISGNSGETGGAVCVEENGTFIIRTGTISNNSANSQGGAVSVNGQNAIMTINGGTISGNTVTYDGGAIAVSNGGTLNISGGSLTGNTAGQNGNTIYIGYDGTLVLSGTNQLDECEIYLENNAIIKADTLPSATVTIIPASYPNSVETKKQIFEPVEEGTPLPSDLKSKFNIQDWKANSVILHDSGKLIYVENNLLPDGLDLETLLNGGKIITSESASLNNLISKETVYFIDDIEITDVSAGISSGQTLIMNALQIANVSVGDALLTVKGTLYLGAVKAADETIDNQPDLAKHLTLTGINSSGILKQEDASAHVCMNEGTLKSAKNRTVILSNGTFEMNGGSIINTSNDKTTKGTGIQTLVGKIILSGDYKFGENTNICTKKTITLGEIGSEASTVQIIPWEEPAVGEASVLFEPLTEGGSLPDGFLSKFTLPTDTNCVIHENGKLIHPDISTLPEGTTLASLLSDGLIVRKSTLTAEELLTEDSLYFIDDAILSGACTIPADKTLTWSALAASTLNLGTEKLTVNGSFTLGDALSITGQNSDGIIYISTDSGSGVTASFTLAGGTITGNTKGPGVKHVSGTLTMTSGEVSNNSRLGGIRCGNGNVTISGGKISGNTTSGCGAGISTSAYTTLVISGGLITENSTTNDSGGGIGGYGPVTITGGTISNNKAKSYGHGIHMEANAKLTLSEAYTFANNVGYPENDIYKFLPSTGTVSAIFLDSVSDEASAVTVTVKTENLPEEGESKQLFSPISGGSLPENLTEKFVINNSDNTFDNTKHELTTDGRLVSTTVNTNVTWADIQTRSYVIFGADSASITTAEGKTPSVPAGKNLTLTATDSHTITLPKTIEVSGTLNLAGKVKLAIPSDCEGRHITVKKDGTLIMNNSATLIGNSDAEKTGGGVSVETSGTFTMNNGTITNCQAENGGGIYASTGSTVTIALGAIYYNKATNHGGGIYVLDDGNVTLNGGEISNNQAYQGAGITTRGTTILNGASISKNTASGQQSDDRHGGGGVFVLSGKFTMKSGSITGNKAEGSSNGGGISATNVYIELKGGTISNNTAALGKGINTGSTLNLTGDFVFGENDGIHFFYLYSDKAFNISSTYVGKAYPVNVSLNNRINSSQSIFTFAGNEIPENFHSMFSMQQNGYLAWSSNALHFYGYSEITGGSSFTFTDSPYFFYGGLEISTGKSLQFYTKQSTNSTIYLCRADENNRNISVKGSLTVGSIATEGSYNLIIKNANGNTGRTFYVDSEADLKLNHGTIDGNNLGGGVYVKGNGNFTMTSGTIQNCMNTGSGAVYTESTFYMEGGTISGNTQYDVFLKDGDESLLSQTGGTIGSTNISTKVELTSESLSSFNPSSYTEGDNIVLNASGLTDSELKNLLDKTLRSSSIKATISVDISQSSVDSLSLSYEVGTAVSRIVLPDNVTSISGQLFQSATNLKEIVISDSNETYKTVDGVLYSKDMTKLLKYPQKKEGSTFTLPDTVTTLGFGAFQKVSILEEVTNLQQITKIVDMEAFNSCTIKNIELNTSMTSLPSYTFEYSKVEYLTLPPIKAIPTNLLKNCNSLKLVKFTGAPPTSMETSQSAEQDINNATNFQYIEVPAAYLEDYKTWIGNYKTWMASDKTGTKPTPTYEKFANMYDPENPTGFIHTY